MSGRVKGGIQSPLGYILMGKGVYCGVHGMNGSDDWMISLVYWLAIWVSKDFGGLIVHKMIGKTMCLAVMEVSGSQQNAMSLRQWTYPILDSC